MKKIAIIIFNEPDELGLVAHHFYNGYREDGENYIVNEYLGHPATKTFHKSEIKCAYEIIGSISKISISHPNMPTPSCPNHG